MLSLVPLELEPPPQPPVSQPVGPRFPHGLMLLLDEFVLGKLGVPGTLPVGSVVNLVAQATVTAAAVSENAQGPHRAVQLQITAMVIEG